MELVCEKNVSHVRGVENSFNYKVANNAKVMNMLAKGMYSNPIKAPVRELSTNAWDAHVEAGNNEPFYVHIPTVDNPVFTIRDYGTGLSQENMEEMYRTYGDSSKTNSNLFNGCLGIGSKSPYAYTDSFLSTSYYNGKKYSYINAKLEDGTPTINRVSIEDTTEPNGLEVSFKVKTDDISKFQQAALEVYPNFPVLPDIKNYNKDNLKYETFLTGDGWFIRTDKQPYAIMGYINYPIDTRYFSDSYSKTAGLQEQWYYKYKTDKSPYVGLLEAGVNIQFEIGEIDHDASREKLQYTEKTIQAIKTRLDAIHLIIKEKFQEEINSKKNFWEAKIFYNKYSKKYSFSSNLEEYTYNGRKFSSVTPIDITKDGFYSSYRYEPRHKNPLKKTYSDQYIYADNITLFVDDLKIKNRHMSFMKEHYKDLQYNDGLRKCYLFKFANDQQKQDLIDKIGISEDNLVYLSSITTPKSSTNRKKYTAVKYVSINSNGYFNEAEFDADTFKTGGVYVEIQKNNVVINGRWVSPYNIINSVLPILGLNNKSLVGVRTRCLKKFQKNKKWTNLEELVNQKVDDFFNNPLHKQYYKEYIIGNTVSCYEFQRLVSYINEIVKVDSPILRLLKILKNNTTANKTLQYNKGVFDLLNYSNFDTKTIQPTQKEISDHKKLIEDLQNRYPLVAACQYSTSNLSMSHLVFYINAVDKDKP